MLDASRVLCLASRTSVELVAYVPLSLRVLIGEVILEHWLCVVDEHCFNYFVHVCNHTIDL